MIKNMHVNIYIYIYMFIYVYIYIYICEGFTFIIMFLFMLDFQVVPRNLTVQISSKLTSYPTVASSLSSARSVERHSVGDPIS